jgi:DNA mismatch endonuclease (patch repair protein)
MAAEMASIGLRWEAHARDLPGRPDFIFREAKVAVFVDGDFWHGWRFPSWRHKLSEKWEQKIEATRLRDRRNHRRLRRAGWIVLRFWEHAVAQEAHHLAAKVRDTVEARRACHRANEAWSYLSPMEAGQSNGS